MRVAIASGKGGAGKTTVTASLAAVWDTPCVVADSDVEAPNLYLFLRPEIHAATPVYLEIPVLNTNKCTLCGACRDICRFKAIARFGKKLSLFGDMCHGCGGCFAVCPEGALSAGQRRLGDLESGFIPGTGHAFLMVRARIGEAMTPPQLRALRRSLDRMLEEVPDGKQKACKDALVDAPPGVSCPAMTVARDVDVVLLVAEPTPFGIHDCKLAHQAFLSLAKPMAVVMNRTAMEGNFHGEEELRRYCEKHDLPVLAELPFSREVAEAYAAGQLIANLSPSWHNRFTMLRDALRDFANQGGAA